MRALPAAALVAKTFVAAAHDCYEPGWLLKELKFSYQTGYMYI